MFLYLSFYLSSHIFLLKAYILLFYSNHEMSYMLAFYRPLNIFLKSYYIYPFLYKYIFIFINSSKSLQLLCKKNPL